MYVLIPLGIATLAGVIYLAVSSKSSPMIRIASLCALALMVLTVIVCLLIIFGVIQSDVQTVHVLPDAVPPSEPAATGSGAITMVLLVIFMLAFFLVIVFLSLREQKRAAALKKEKDIPKNNW